MRVYEFVGGEPMNQSKTIKESILKHLDKGVINKREIFDKVVEELKVPRPTVRRVARDLRVEFQRKIRILQQDGVSSG